ncbi:MAG: hypothetical protein ACKVOH_01700, partial [Chlamydiales bacterium]
MATEAPKSPSHFLASPVLRRVNPRTTSGKFLGRVAVVQTSSASTAATVYQESQRVRPPIKDSMIQETLQAIDDSPLSVYHPLYRLHLQSRIETILTFPRADALVELGVLRYYLCRAREMPDLSCSTFLALRIKEINSRLNELDTEHRFSCGSLADEIPAAISTELRRTLARMVICSNRFSEAGSLAVARLVPFLDAKFIAPLHAQQIVAIATSLAKDSKYRLLFSKVLAQEFTVAPSMERLVRLEWQFPTTHTLSNELVACVVVKVLFTLHVQIHRPNCFAIAGLNAVTSVLPLAKVELLISMLATGYYQLKDSCIPIAPIVTKHLSSSRSATSPVSPATLARLTPCAHIYEILLEDGHETNFSSSTSDEGFVPLGKALERVFSPTTLPFAQQTFQSFTDSPLLFALTCGVELSHNNQLDAPSESPKEKLLASIVAAAVPIQLPDIRRKLYEALCQIVFFENCTETMVEREENFLVAGSDGFRFPIPQDMETQFRALLHDAQYLVIVRGETYEVLHTIRQLRSIVSELVATIPLSVIEKEIIDQNLETNFLFRIAQLLEDESGVAAIGAKEFLEANLLVFQQVGGIPKDVVESR